MLAQRGLRVCVLDKARFPSEALSTHVIQPSGVVILKRYGMLDPILTAGAVTLSGLTLVDEGTRLDAQIDPESFGAMSISARRITLDQVLVEEAARAGVEVRTETRVSGLIWEDGRVCGVQTSSGDVRAQLVVGADGVRSTVAELVAAREYRVAPPGRMFAWGYFEGVGDTEARLRLASLQGLTFAASPTDAGLYMAAVCPAMSRRDAFLANRESSYRAGIAAWPELADILARANRVGPIRVMSNWHGYFRQATGPGWTLVGDAGHFKDPTPAQGIRDALHHSERLARAIEAGLGGASDIDDELRRWWQWRDSQALEMHWFASDMGSRGLNSPIATQIVRDIADDPAAVEQFLRMLNRDIQPSELFTAGRVGKAALRVALRQPARIPAMLREATREAVNQARRSRQRHPSLLKGSSA
jgi:2-polyprenyl-6-methoxyphenol hydroxylase-like FAD-dependent oxidoreductase